MKAGLLLDQAVQLGAQPGRVRYLIEVCDPSEDGQYAYQVNGVIVSDFYTPNFLDPVKSAGVRYSFTESMDGPRIVMPNGYISWYDPKAKTWMQLRNFADSESSNVPHLVDLGKNAMFQKHAASKNIRSAVDRVTKVPSFTQDLHGSVKTRMTSSSAFNRQSEESCANELRAVIQGLMPAAKSKK